MRKSKTLKSIDPFGHISTRYSKNTIINSEDDFPETLDDYIKFIAKGGDFDDVFMELSINKEFLSNNRYFSYTIQDDNIINIKNIIKETLPDYVTVEEETFSEDKININIEKYFIETKMSKCVITHTITKDKVGIILTFISTGYEGRYFSELTNVLYRITNEYETSKEKFSFLFSTARGMDIRSIEGTVSSNPLQVENYNDNVCAAYDNIIEKWSEFNGECGRLLILSGEPGTGKTYFIRSLQHSLKKKAEFISIASSIAHNLTSPEFLSVLAEYKECEMAVDEPKSIILVIEDADSLLQKRDGFNNDLVSIILNLTDGIFASTFDIKIIMSTNVEYGEFDEALTRNGRLFDHLIFEPLTDEKANAFFDIHKCDKELPEKTTIANLFSVIKNEKKKSNEAKKKKIGF